jgi:type I restriction enzyme M protein
VNPSADLVSRLWRLCAVLRKDGITYPQYVAELTYLLFLKMMHETAAEDSNVPEGLRWENLLAAGASQKLDVYRRILAGLGNESGAADHAIRAIFQGSATVIREPRNIEMLIDAIDKQNWFSAGRDSFGDLYEGLLQKNAEETKRGAGQYFTPRVIIDVLVDLMKPKPGEVIQDPAAGTGGFLIAADRHIRMNFPASKRRTKHVISGMENVQETYRLLLMNLYLHGVDGSNVDRGDTLSQEYETLKTPDVILTNPPFGPAGGRATRTDLTITAAVASYQLPFVEHCIRALPVGGRVAIVVPDNVLFEDGRARLLRQFLMTECDLHTILRLPTGIFYAQGVKTNVLFFRRGPKGVENTRDVWIYDLRTNMPIFGRTSPLKKEHFQLFIDAYGDEPNGLGRRIDEGITGRFRKFTRDDIRARGENMDLTWLRDEDIDLDASLSEPEELAAAIVGHLRTALAELESIAEEVELDTISELAGTTVE